MTYCCCCKGTSWSQWGWWWWPEAASAGWGGRSVQWCILGCNASSHRRGTVGKHPGWRPRSDPRNLKSDLINSIIIIILFKRVMIPCWSVVVRLRLLLDSFWFVTSIAPTTLHGLDCIHKLRGMSNLGFRVLNCEECMSRILSSGCSNRVCIYSIIS